MKKIIVKTPPKIEYLYGSIGTSYVKCSRKNCKCNQGELHGPYFYRYWREKGKRHKQYINREEVEAVQAACRTYREQRRQVRQNKKAQLAQWHNLKAKLKEVSNNE